MNFSALKFDSKDIVKLLGFVGFMTTMWTDLKTEQAAAREERRSIQQQLAKHDVYISDLRNAVYFIKPNEPAVRTYRRQ